MGQKIFQLLNGGQLVEQNETAYEQETHLQELLMNNPDLMDGALIDEDNPRRWLLVKREASVLINNETGNYGSLDHLFLDQDGIPTLVEVKRSEEREQLTMVYLALLEGDAMTKEDRELILQSLFSRVDTGLLGDDGAPTMPGIGSILEKR